MTLEGAIKALRHLHADFPTLVGSRGVNSNDALLHSELAEFSPIVLADRCLYDFEASLVSNTRFQCCQHYVPVALLRADRKARWKGRRCDRGGWGRGSVGLGTTAGSTVCGLGIASG